MSSACWPRWASPRKMGRVPDLLPEPRACCARCLRPVRVCVCALLPRLSPRTRVVIVQHPREHRVAIGTARMTVRALQGARLVVGVEVDDDPGLAAALGDPAAPPVLLMPGPGARNLRSDPPPGPVTLVAVDGTWHHARKMLKVNPRLAALPRYAIDPEAPSAYRIRREPSAECLSTLEALAQALGWLEGDPEAYRALMVPFRAMVDAQLREHAANRVPRDKSRLKQRRRRPWVVPPGLADLARVLVVSLDSDAWPLRAQGRVRDQVVALWCVGGDGSEPVELLVRPSRPLAPSTARRTGLPEAELLGGAPREALARLLGQRAGPHTTLAFWGSYALGLLREEGLPLGAGPVDLRAVASRWLRTAPGSLEHCARQVGGTPPVLGRGRGGGRLGLALHVLRALQGPRPD